MKNLIIGKSQESSRYDTVIIVRSCMYLKCAQYPHPLHNQNAIAVSGIESLVRVRKRQVPGDSCQPWHVQVTADKTIALGRSMDATTSGRQSVRCQGVQKLQ